MAAKKSRNVNYSAGFLEAINALGKERGIDEKILYDAIKDALMAAYKRNFGSAQNVDVELDEKVGAYHVYAVKDVVENVKDKIRQIDLESAQKISPKYTIGDSVRFEVTPANFGRIAAQTAKQIVVQRIREAERTNVYDEYSNRNSELVSGIIVKTENHNVIIDLGDTEAVLAATEQVPGEVYKHGKKIRAYLLEVKKTNKGPQVYVSRTHPGFLRALFTTEVPEIQNGLVEIKSVAREPGSRAKIAVRSNDLEVDPVGACVGQKGLRVQAVVDQIGDEKIDIIKWNFNSATYIANALSPAKVVSVAVNEETKVSRVIVPDYQLSLAIGKEGQNARLAAKLTGWKIDIKSESQAVDEVLEEGMFEFRVVADENNFTAGEE